MSALAPRNSYRVAEEQEWLESSNNLDLSPASVWAPDYEEEDETTLPGRRADVQYLDLMSPNIEEETLVVETPRQVRILDESSVLPGEASFATVSLNQPFEEHVLKPQDSFGVDEDRERRSTLRVRLLDESQVLDGEASFATVLGSYTKAPRHSPITEFLVKTKLSVKQLVLAMVAVSSVLALAVIALWGMMSSRVVTVSSGSLPATSQTESTLITEPPDSFLISNSQGGVSGSVNPIQATVEETEVVLEEKLIERSSSDNSRTKPANEAKAGAVRQEISREVNPVGARVNLPKERVIETKKPSVASKAVKQQALVKTPNASASKEPRSEPVTKRNAAPVRVENLETKTPAATGGGERPRTVTRRPSP